MRGWQTTRGGDSATQPMQTLPCGTNEEGRNQWTQASSLFPEKKEWEAMPPSPALYTARAPLPVNQKIFGRKVIKRGEGGKDT